MSLSDVEKVLHAVGQSLTMCPRNAYEARNRYEKNIESLSKARTTLKEYNGSRIDELVAELSKLEAAVEREKGTCMQDVAGSHSAFSFDFEDLETKDEGGVEDEMTRAEAMLKIKNRNKGTRTEKGKKSNSTKKSALNKGKDPDRVAATASVMNISDAIGPSIASSQGCGSSPNTDVAPRSFAEIARKDNSREDGMPFSALGYQYCEPLANSALAAVYYAEEMEYEGRTCGCRIELYRAVLLALNGGKPVVDDAFEENLIETVQSATMEGKVESGEDAISDQLNDNSAASNEDADDDNGISYLSSKLVNDYEAAETAREKAEADANFPRNVSLQLASRLQQFPFLTWVILICHGGYFAGGVFVKGRCVIHKAFQRYVVRKKQGGKQSTNAKDGSTSYHSAGSMIRAAQELEWKLDVRNIILAWQPYIDRASLILHAAPGPQNLAILTDFSSLPPLSSGAVKPSPINAKDPRVQRVPITTHRPKFEEVQRIYDIVSQYNVVYVIPE